MSKYKYAMITTEHKCLACSGRGWNFGCLGENIGNCRDCNGSGKYEITKKRRVYIQEVK